MFDRWAGLSGLVLLFGMGVLWRCLHQLRRYGTIGFSLFSRDSWSVAPLLALGLGVLAFAQAILAAVAPDLVVPFVVPLGTLGAVMGVALTLAGTALMVIAQLSLGASWRIGIDPSARPGLVTGGTYRLSRNPIFLCMLIAMTGVSLLLPTPLSALLLIASWVAVRHQVKEEERWLSQTYGDGYRAYAARVGRFLPWAGRLVS